MAGHNKWSKIKHKKAITDSKKSATFAKMSMLIAMEAKKANGDKNSPGLRSAIEKAKSVNMPQNKIDRAIENALKSPENVERLIYEAYGPGQAAMIIEAISGNRNKAVAEIKHILSKNQTSLGEVGSVSSWAFKKDPETMQWQPKIKSEINPTDKEKLDKLIEELEDNSEVHQVYTNVEDEK